MDTLSRKQRRMIENNNKNGKRLIIPMFGLNGKNFVTTEMLPFINHPKKIFLLTNEDTFNIIKEFKELGKDGDYISDIINNEENKDHWDYCGSEKTTLIKWKNKYYEWESGKEVIIR